MIINQQYLQNALKYKAMYGVLFQIEAYLSLKKCMATPNFQFGYQEHLLSSTSSA